MNLYSIIKNKWSNSKKLAVSIINEDLSIKSLDYVSLFNQVEALAESISHYGISPGQKVAIIAPNMPEWIITYLAINKLGAVSVLLDATLPPTELLKLLEQTEVNLIFTTMPIGDSLIKEKLLKTPLINIKTDNPKTAILNKSICSFDSRIDQELIDKDICSILFSSGTTSVPTGIMHSHKAFIETTISCLNANNINNVNRYMNPLPLNHIYGLLAFIYAPLLTNSEVRLFGTLNQKTLGHTLENFNPTFIGAVPKLCELLKSGIEQKVKAENKEKIFYKCLNLSYKIREKTKINIAPLFFKKSVYKAFGGKPGILSTAGAPAREETIKFFLGLGFRIINTYGLTETNVPVAGTRNKNLNSNSIGQPYPNVEVKISKDGELLVRSPYLMKGYYKNPDLTKEFMPDDYFHTGDLGFFNSKGQLVITGRLKENIVLSTGKKVFPENLEENFMSIKPLVDDFAVCGKKIDGMQYDEVHMFIVSSNQDLVRDKIREINKNLPSYMRITKIHFIDSIPRTALEKVKRFALLDKIGKDEPVEQQETISFDEQIIKDCLRIANLDIDYKTISRDTRLASDLGIDSISTITLLLELEEKFGIDLSDAAELNPDMTIDDFLKFIKSKLNT